MGDQSTVGKLEETLLGLADRYDEVARALRNAGEALRTLRETKDFLSDRQSALEAAKGDKALTKWFQEVLAKSLADADSETRKRA